ncbi:hypothetical protein, partial [Undibacterium sp. SXout20W]|uniref:hypothetical protein n=1 Tax=Undibacterium sp. SXout20W TaxID=3413051 RepID=UPI003BF096E0
PAGVDSIAIFVLGRGSCLLLNFETKECGAFISSLLDGCVGRLLLNQKMLHSLYLLQKKFQRKKIKNTLFLHQQSMCQTRHCYHLGLSLHHYLLHSTEWRNNNGI